MLLLMRTLIGDCNVGTDKRKRPSGSGGAKASRQFIFIWTFICWTDSPEAAQQSESLRASQIAVAYGKLPISFEPNLGQTDARVNFLAHASGYLLLLKPTGATLSLSGAEKSQSKMT